jgi:tripartite-type tricarboxylate transporter receptor subunit TctC
MKKLQALSFVFCLMLSLAFIPWAFSGDFPSRPITIVVNYNPGGAHDIIARALQAPLAEALKTPVIIENKPGGSTKIGTTSVRKADPDGYTLGIQTPSAWLRYHLAGVYDYKPWVELTPIGSVCREVAWIIEVRSESPLRSWQDLVKEAKKRPGELTCSGPAATGSKAMGFKVSTKAAGIECQYVPFKGNKPAQTALLGGHVDFSVTGPANSVPMMRAGKTRGLAISSDGRFWASPSVPTFTELGLGDPYGSFIAIWAPGGLSQDIATILAKGLEKAVKDPGYIDIIKNRYFMTPEYMNAMEITKAMLKEEEASSK